MAACRTVNANTLWQQTLNQPLVTASWNDLKTCVTFWPNLGWCSTSLTRTEARTALMTSDFHYKPAVDPNVHSGWDRGCNGSAAPFGQECSCSLGIYWAMVFSPLLFTYLALKSRGCFLLLFTTVHEHQLSQSSLCQHPSWFSFALQLSSWCWMVWLCGLLPVNNQCSSAQTLHYSDVSGLLVQVWVPGVHVIQNVCWNALCWPTSLCDLMSHQCGLIQAGMWQPCARINQWNRKLASV